VSGDLHQLAHEGQHLSAHIGIGYFGGNPLIDLAILEQAAEKGMLRLRTFPSFAIL
jgi:hypothetical protein